MGPWGDYRTARAYHLRVLAPVLAFHQRQKSGPRLAPRTAGSPGPGTGETRTLRCGTCRATVTTEAARTDRDGGHVHRVRNPGGYRYEIGCFSAAPGCTVQGEPTLEHTWFLGFAWRYALCAACNTHLGWSYERQEEHFFGLILDQLTLFEPG
jgi:hypothetical protein